MVRLVHFPALLLALVTATFAGESAAAKGYADGPTVHMPGELAGKVIHVADGDTLTLLDGQHFKRIVRLTDIDAPESGHGASRPGQPYSTRSGQALKSLTYGREVRAFCYDIDARKRDDGTTRERYVCRVFVDDVDVNIAMIDAGMAMANRASPRYVRDPQTFTHEATARRDRRGLWAQPSPIPPWEWRRSCWERKECNGAGE